MSIVEESFSSWLGGAGNTPSTVEVRHEVSPIVYGRGSLDGRRLWAHQVAAQSFVRSRWEQHSGAWLGGMLMGTGKTAATLAAIAGLRDDVGKKALNVIVLGPKATLGVWGADALAWLGDENVACFVPRKKSSDARFRELESFLRADHDDRMRIVVLNYESLRSPRVLVALADVAWDVMVCDESHRVKAPRGKTADILFNSFSLRVPYRVGLTGTPTPLGMVDLFSQCRIVEPSVWGYTAPRGAATRFNDWRMRYCVSFLQQQVRDFGSYRSGMPERQAREIIVGYQNESELVASVAPMFFGCEREVVEIPPIHHVDVAVPLEHKTWSEYEKLRKSGLLEIVNNYGSDDAVVASNILVEGLRLSQVLSGAVPTEGGDLIIVGDEKARVLSELLDSAGASATNPVVVFCRFKHSLSEVERVCTSLGLTYGELSGSRRDGLSDDSTLAEGCAVVGVQYASGGAGVRFERASVGVMFDQTYNNGEFEQAVARLHRPGQQRLTRFFHMIGCGPDGESTMDHTMIEARVLKARLSDVVLGMVADRTTIFAAGSDVSTSGQR